MQSGANRGSIDDVLLELKTIYAAEGVRAAVVFLNSTTAHRFTSLYRFDGPTLRNVTFYDRLNPTAEKCDDIPVEASYCVFVRDLHSAFLVSDAPEDDRVEGHEKRETVKRYCGVPLVGHDGKLCGSICHFDLEPGPIDDRDVELLERMASLLRPAF